MLWKGLLISLALVSFAASLEGYLFTWLSYWQRLLMLVGTVLVFFPTWRWEVLGLALLLLGMVINQIQSRDSASKHEPIARA